jgi:hypothetical protein
MLPHPVSKARGIPHGHQQGAGAAARRFHSNSRCCVAAGGTLLGSQLANANARQQLSAQLSHEDRVRQYEVRRDAYENFFSAAGQYELDLETVSVLAGEKGGSLSVKDFRELTDDSARLLTVAAEVQVFGSVKAVRLANAVRIDLNDILNSALSDRLSPGDTNIRANRNEGKLNLFIDAAHDELKKATVSAVAPS